MLLFAIGDVTIVPNIIRFLYLIHKLVNLNRIISVIYIF